MRILAGQLAPIPGDPARNADRLAAAVRSVRCDLAVFPELFLSGYRVGDRIHRLALRDGHPVLDALRATAAASHAVLVVGTPLASAERAGEVHNAALAVLPDGTVSHQTKRYLPTFGPFEEGVPFTATDTSRPVVTPAAALGLEICYDVFFPEVSRDLALAGAHLLVAISAAPVTSRRLFDRLLPARAIENALPVVYVNRVGVEDGVVFGGGTAAWDARGEAIAAAPIPFSPAQPEEALTLFEVDLGESSRWRPFRPVLRDVTSRPAHRSSAGAPPSTDSIPTRPL